MFEPDRDLFSSLFDLNGDDNLSIDEMAFGLYSLGLLPNETENGDEDDEFDFDDEEDDEDE